MPEVTVQKRDARAAIGHIPTTNARRYRRAGTHPCGMLTQC